MFDPYLLGQMAAVPSSSVSSVLYLQKHKPQPLRSANESKVKPLNQNHATVKTCMSCNEKQTSRPLLVTYCWTSAVSERKTGRR